MKLLQYAPLNKAAAKLCIIQILAIVVFISGASANAANVNSAKNIMPGNAGSLKKGPITGRVTSDKGEPLVGVSIKVKGSTQGTSTDVDGKFAMTVPNDAVLQVVYIGYVTQEIRVNNRSTINVQLVADAKGLEEVVVTGYGKQKKGSITGAVSSVTSKDIDRVHAGSTVSSTLAGKLPGVTFRMPDGRPGASANIQIRNMGRPLYVIDGVQQDEGQFNNLAPNDIESITVLKDASAAIYGVRAANGVVVVTTKQGSLNSGSRINIDAYLGFQDWYRFPDVLTNSYDYMSYRADAEVNSNIFNSDPTKRTNITQDELNKYQQGESAGPQYRSFNWRDYVLEGGAPQNQVNVNFTGGSDKINYYVSGTNLFQNSVLGREYKFNRTNIQSNITAKVAQGLRVSAQINGRIETRQNPGVPGGDDYFLSRLAVLRNTPTERPYANDNPEYLNDLGPHLESNYAFLNEKISGKLKGDWRVLQTNFSADYDIPGVKGLSVRGAFSYYLADYLLNNAEYTYKAYTYRPATDTYDATGGSTNPWREREQRKEFNNTYQAQINYNNTFGKHTIGGTVVAERIKLRHLRNWIHASPISNNLPLIYFPTADTYDDSDNQEARIGYIGRLNYNYANKYYLEVSARRDASYLFAPDQRVGYFPGVSAGWRITEEQFMKNLLGEDSFLNDLKFRGSYGVLGDDRNPNDPNQPIVAPYAYLPGYNYNQGISVLDGNSVTTSADKGIPVTQISWLKSKITDIGADFTVWNNKLTGTVDYFYRKRTGLLGVRNDILLPAELGYGLPSENLNSDAQQGGEFSLAYTSKIGQVNFNIGGNASYSRAKNLNSYNPTFFNSWDQYRNSTENRYSHIDWGYEVDGQFQSFQEINDYKVNIDGQGNSTMIPGDLKYKDQNGDGIINGFDERPIGFGYGTQPNINFGLNLGLAYKNWDFHADFSGGSGYTWFQNWETRWAFQNNGNLNSIFEDRWHRADIYDVNSEWIPGKYPANRYNVGLNHIDYGVNGNTALNSTFWLHNVKYIRARTIELGYSLPKKWISKVGMQRARVYANAYNLFSFDNLREFNVDPEVADDNGLQFPQNKVINFGVNVTF